MPVREAGLRYTVLGSYTQGPPLSFCRNEKESQPPSSLTGKQDLNARVGLDDGSSPTQQQRGQPRFSKLCVYCQHLFDRVASIKEEGEVHGANWYLGQPGEAHRHVETESELKASEERGCGLCSQLFRAKGPEKDKSDYEFLRKHNWPKAGFVWLHFHLEQLDGIGGWQMQLVVRRRDHGIPVVYIANFPSEGSDPTSSSRTTKDALPQAKAWLTRCMSTHHTCNITDCYNQDSKFPTRLLDLRNETIRLCQGIDVEPGTKYATLSHCWGDNHFLTLKRDNYHEFLSQIPAEALSRTFLHAIEITQYLGFQYLWIDSLCIIQDSNDDWEKESSLMSSVYSCSTINLAASGASDGSQGCFFDRDEVALWESRSSSIQENLEKMPLSTRGWAVQERILPRRTLFFTRTEVYWECANLTACERIPAGAPYVLDNRLFLERQPVKEDMWDAVVRHYTRCNLTMSRDKLVAISGIARLIYHETQDEYVAGLWRTDIKHQLLWSSAKPSRKYGKNTRPPEYRAPSWSWAAIDGPVDTVICKEGSFVIEIDDIQIKYCVEDNPFGEIESASLRISSHNQLLRGFIQPLKLDTNPNKGESSEGKCFPSFVCCSPSLTHEGAVTWQYIAFPRDKTLCYWGSANLDTLSDLRNEYRDMKYYSVVILPVVADGTVPAFTNHSIPRRSTGLVLLETGAGQYRRIGTCFGHRGTTQTSLQLAGMGYRYDTTSSEDLTKDQYYSKISTDENGKKLYFIDLV